MSRYLIDKSTGQFYAVYRNIYQCLCTISRLLHNWEPGQLMDEIATTQCAFGYMGPSGPVPAPAPGQLSPLKPLSAATQEEQIPDLVTQKPPPRTVPYHPPSFTLDRPTR